MRIDGIAEVSIELNVFDAVGTRENIGGSEMCDR
jgi:hypothetical protein